MILNEFTEYLKYVFEDTSLYGFSVIDNGLAKISNCKSSLVTLQPFPDMEYKYNSIELYTMLEELRKKHTEKLTKIKKYLDEHSVLYETPPASPKDDGQHKADFSYKWSAIHAGLGFIGKNDVFVHFKYAQRVRISCLLINFDLPVFKGKISSKCGNCDICVKACPHHLISGKTWDIEIKREELIDYSNCATKSYHSGEGKKYLCAFCSLACTYPNVPF